MNYKEYKYKIFQLQTGLEFNIPPIAKDYFLCRPKTRTFKRHSHYIAGVHKRVKNSINLTIFQKVFYCDWSHIPTRN